MVDRNAKSETHECRKMNNESQSIGDVIVPRKGSRFFWTYFAMYMVLLIAGIIVTIICEPEAFQDNDGDGIAALIIVFFLSATFGAGLGIIPAILLENGKKQGYVYLCVLLFFVLNLLAAVLTQFAFGILLFLPIAYLFPFVLMSDIFNLQVPIFEGIFWADFLYFTVFPTLYYLLLVWVSLRVSGGRRLKGA